MNDTSAALLRAATDLFADHGFDGASVRAITARAGVNLGAVTYHFGSKSELYHQVLEQATGPLRQALAQAADRVSPGGFPVGAPERIEAVIRAFFEHLFHHPELRRIMLQQVSLAGDLDPAAIKTGRFNHRLIADLIQQGQEEGAIRDGDPRMLAFSVAAQPIAMTFAMPVLRQGIGIDVQERAVHQRMVDNAVAFISAGLARTERSEESP